jgi:hypothetical protein
MSGCAISSRAWSTAWASEHHRRPHRPHEMACPGVRSTRRARAPSGAGLIPWCLRHLRVRRTRARAALRPECRGPPSRAAQKKSRGPSAVDSPHERGEKQARAVFQSGHHSRHELGHLRFISRFQIDRARARCAAITRLRRVGGAPHGRNGALAPHMGVGIGFRGPKNGFGTRPGIGF